MSNPFCACDLLNDRDAPLAAKYVKAWELLNRSTATVEERLHAYVWLGYRVLDGGMKVEDWTSHLGRPDASEIADNEIRARWTCSQLTVEFCINILIKNQMAPITQVNRFGLSYWPNNLTSYLRISAITAYAYHLDGDCEGAKGLAMEAISEWKHIMSTFDSLSIRGEYRFAEMHLDSLPLQVLNTILTGGIDFVRHRWVIERLENQPQHISYWWKCIRKLEDNPKSLFKKL